MTHKQIDAAREVRLWIGQIVVPAVTTVAVAMAIPEVRQNAVNKVKDIKRHIQVKRSKRKIEKQMKKEES